MARDRCELWCELAHCRGHFRSCRSAACSLPRRRLSKMIFATLFPQNCGQLAGTRRHKVDICCAAAARLTVRSRKSEGQSHRISIAAQSGFRRPRLAIVNQHAEHVHASKATDHPRWGPGTEQPSSEFETQRSSRSAAPAPAFETHSPTKQEGMHDGLPSPTEIV